MIRSVNLEKSLDGLDKKVSALNPRAAEPAAAIAKWRSDAAAAMFHLESRGDAAMVVCILGGTGTGKSTVVNRLLESNVSAASFRRTFTTGAVAVSNGQGAIPQGWLGLPRIVAPADQLPARGRNDALIVIESEAALLKGVTLVDTPDLDGDQPAHHAQADRVFRWAEGIIFLVSPEKYQMTELLPYYRLAKRYEIPAIFVMNKCETPAMLEDYRKMLGVEEGAVFAIARDDAAYEAPAEGNLAALRRTIGSLARAPEGRRRSGAAVRVKDLLGRLRDQVLGPMRRERRAADAAISALKAMEAPSSGVDVNPITEQLERRLQQRSVLYLIGPGRIMDRVRQAPAMLARLPRTAWDMVFHSKAPKGSDEPQAARQVPDFSQMLIDQFTIVQSRIDDALTGTGAGPRWMAHESLKYAACKIDPSEAGKIAVEELEALNAWLKKRWDATPRDTVLLLKLLRHLPGGEKLTQWTEAAPYLLAIIVATHHAFFGHVDLMILGGYSAATWLMERLSNEVKSRTRQTNRAIASRFEKLVHEQLARVAHWLENLTPAMERIDAVGREADELEESITP